MCLCVLLESQTRVEREKREGGREGWGTYWVFGGVEEDERDDEEGCEAYGEEGEKSERVGTFGFECAWLDRSS